MYKKIIFIIVLIIIFCGIVMYPSHTLKNSNDREVEKIYSNGYVSDDNGIDSDVNDIDDKKYDNNIVQDGSSEVVIDNNTIINNELVSVNNDNNVSNVIYTEDDVVNYYSVKDSDSDNVIKEKFVSVIDFIFYDKEIYGYTFKGITDSAKEKIIAIAIMLDSKIDSKFPGYKESISDKYNGVKNKLVSEYMDLGVTVCSYDTLLCEKIKSNVKEFKGKFGITWDNIKGFVSNNFKKLKNWYEIWRYE